MSGYRYTGTGERYAGVPARDLTEEEFEALGPLEKRTVVESGSYKEVAKAKADTPEPNADDKKGGK